MAIGKRTAAACVSALAVAGLAVQFYVSLGLTDSNGAALWAMAQYFTVLTNLGVAIIMVAVAVGWRVGGAVLLPLTVAILVVGIVYHAVLAQLWQPAGAAWLADQLLHSVVPVAMLIWWSIFGARGQWPHVPLCTIWPIAYCVFAMVNGAVTGFYPYPFLNVPLIGVGALLINLVGLLAAFLLLGAVLVLISRRIQMGRQ